MNAPGELTDSNRPDINFTKEEWDLIFDCVEAEYQADKSAGRLTPIPAWKVFDCSPECCPQDPSQSDS